MQTLSIFIFIDSTGTITLAFFFFFVGAVHPGYAGSQSVKCNLADCTEFVIVADDTNR